MAVTLYIVAESRAGGSMALARVDNRQAVLTAAAAAIAEAEARASNMDSELAELQRDEVEQLRRCLHRAIPELRFQPAVM